MSETLVSSVMVLQNLARKKRCSASSKQANTSSSLTYLMNDKGIPKILKLSRIGMDIVTIARAQQRIQQFISLDYDAFLQSYEE